MSDTNRVAIRATKEVTLGVAPVSPDLQELVITGAPSLAFAPGTVESEQIRSDRQLDDLPLVSGEAAGDINAEHAFEVHDILLEGAIFNLFQDRYDRANNPAETQITSVTGGTEEVATTDEGDAPTVGGIVRHTGFSVPGNNGFFTVATVTANTAYTTNENLEDETPPDGAQTHEVGVRGAAGDIDAATGPDSITSTILDFTTLDLQGGDWIKLLGFDGNPVNDDWVRIAAGGVSVNEIIFDIVPAGWAADTPVGSVDIYFGERLLNGILRQSYFLEEEFGGTTPDDPTYQYFSGMVVDAMALTAAAQSIATIVFTFSGLTAEFSDSTTPATGFPVDGTGRISGATTLPAAPVNVLNTSSNVGRIARGGTPISGTNAVLEATVEIGNNLRQLPAVGTLGAINIGVGQVSATGTLNTYFDNADLARDVISNAETSFDIRLEDTAQHAIVIDNPRIKFSEGAPEVPGKNEDVTINLGYQAIRDPDFNYTVHYARFWGFQ